MSSFREVWTGSLDGTRWMIRNTETVKYHAAKLPVNAKNRSEEKNAVQSAAACQENPQPYARITDSSVKESVTEGEWCCNVHFSQRILKSLYLKCSLQMLGGYN